MFTLKFIRKYETVVVEVRKFRITELNGPGLPAAQATGAVVSAFHSNDSDELLVGDPYHQGASDMDNRFEVLFVENSSGKTIHRVGPFVAK